MKLKRIQVFFTIVLFVFVLTDLIFTQQRQSMTGRGKARIRGKVTDKDKKPIAGAQVEMLFQDKVTKFTTKTNKKGKWAILGLGTGNFTITIKSDGYVPVVLSRYIEQLKPNAPVVTKMERAIKPVVKEDYVQFLDEGNVLFEQRKFTEAIEAYQKIIENHPELYQVKYKIGVCYRENLELGKALQIYEEVLIQAEENEDKDTSAMALGEIGGIHLQKKDFEKAQSYFKKSIEVDPSNEITAYNVGEINFNNNKIDTAIEYFEIAVKIKPTWSEPYLKLAYSYLNKGDNMSAIKNLKKVVELEPDSKNGQIAKGILDSLSVQKK